MNRSTLISIVSIGLLCSAVRAEGPIEQPAEYRQPAPSAVTRDEVKADLRAARESGEMDALVGEDSGSFYLARIHNAAVRYAARDMLAAHATPPDARGAADAARSR